MEVNNLILFVIGFLLHVGDCYNATKVIYCINSVVFFMMTVKVYTASPSIGPKLVMIRKMVGSLVHLKLILAYMLSQTSDVTVKDL